MTDDVMHSVIRQRFQTEIVGQEPALTTIYDNQLKEPPESGVWVRLNIMKGEAFKVENPGLFRTPGIMRASVFNTLGRGDGEQLTLAKKIVAAFRNRFVDGIVYRTPSTITIGRDEKWWRIDVDCPFHADDLE